MNQENPKYRVNMIPIKISEQNGKQAASAKELHLFLEIDTRFDIWIQRMFEYGFTENTDYQCLYKSVQMPNGGSKQALDDYALTLDCAKEISMIQRSEKGKIARQYFIDCENKLKNLSVDFSNPDTVLQLVHHWKNEKERRIEAEMIIEQQRPKVLFAEALEISNQNILIGELSKILKQNKIEIGQNRLFDWLRSNNYLMKQGEQYNLPTQKSMELGLFEVKTSTINNPDGSVRTTKTTKVTPKGQSYFINKFLEQNKTTIEIPKELQN